MCSFVKTDLDKTEISREQHMAKRLMQYNNDAKYVPGKKMEAPDFGSGYPIFDKNHELFETEVGRLGISVRIGM